MVPNPGWESPNFNSYANKKLFIPSLGGLSVMFLKELRGVLSPKLPKPQGNLATKRALAAREKQITETMALQGKMV